VSSSQDDTDILIAELGAVGFESFEETQNGVQAYIAKDDWDQGLLKEITSLQKDSLSLTSVDEIAPENWNETWESNFQAIVVDDVCTVRAPFHQPASTKMDIVIEPKMSFGTGHHETTHMMIQFVLKEDFSLKTVLDMGSGTGVLAILAEKQGAIQLEAIDIDAWCFENATENIERNRCKNITPLLGDASLLTNKKYDVILANINRNILLQDIPTYTSALQAPGILILSGFYEEDLPLIVQKCTENGLTFDSHLQKEKWIAAKFVL
jgi:ribosomal protein L11 methyltransferase